MTFTRYFVIHVKRRKVRRMNDYAEQLGYKNDLDFLNDFGDYNDILSVVENTIKVAIKRSPKDAVNTQNIFRNHLCKLLDELMNEISATHIIDDILNELVEEIVDADINLRNEVRRD